MKVSLNNLNSLKGTGNYTQPKSVDIVGTKGKEQKQNYDTITISATEASAMSDSLFINLLKNNISNEVKAGASSYKLNDLSKQIALKQYDVNPIDIAKKIMLDNGEV